MQRRCAFRGVATSTNTNGRGLPRSFGKICINRAGEHGQREAGAECHADTLPQVRRTLSEEGKVYVFCDSHIGERVALSLNLPDVRAGRDIYKERTCVYTTLNTRCAAERCGSGHSALGLP